MTCVIPTVQAPGMLWTSKLNRLALSALSALIGLMLAYFAGKDAWGYLLIAFAEAFVYLVPALLLFPIEKRKKSSNAWGVVLALGLLFSGPSSFIQTLWERYLRWLGFNGMKVTGVEEAKDFTTFASQLFLYIIAAPISEEWFLRKLQSFMQGKLKQGTAIVFCAVLFGLFHRSLVALPSLLLMGVCAGYLYAWTNCLLAATVFHQGYNLAAFFWPRQGVSTLMSLLLGLGFLAVYTFYYRRNLPCD